MRRPDWWPKWDGGVCVIVASGPSAKGADLSIARGLARVIVVNDSWRLAPWADVLYACDCKWWQAHYDELDFPGLKVTMSANCPFPLNVVDVAMGGRIITDEPRIGSGSNSGFQAANLAVQFGAKKLVWVGFDMRVDLGVHWHGMHGKKLNNPTEARVSRWRKYLDDAAGDFARLGVEVINTSTVSALKNYPKMSFAEAMKGVPRG